MDIFLYIFLVFLNSLRTIIELFHHIQSQKCEGFSTLRFANFEKPCGLIILEQLKNVIFKFIITHVNNQKVKTAAEALTNDYMSTHKYDLGEFLYP